VPPSVASEAEAKRSDAAFRKARAAELTARRAAADAALRAEGLPPVAGRVHADIQTET
jgi:hypothetical protein